MRTHWTRIAAAALLAAALPGCIATHLQTDTVTLTRIAIATDVRVRAKGPGVSIDEQQGQASLERLLDAAADVLTP